MLSDFGLVDQDTQLQIIAEHLGTEVVDLRSDLHSRAPRHRSLGTAQDVSMRSRRRTSATLQHRAWRPVEPVGSRRTGFHRPQRAAARWWLIRPKSIEKIIDKHYGDRKWRTSVRS
jgi:hypothetical protein